MLQPEKGAEPARRVGPGALERPPVQRDRPSFEGRKPPNRRNARARESTRQRLSPAVRTPKSSEGVSAKSGFPRNRTPDTGAPRPPSTGGEPLKSRISSAEPSWAARST